MRVCVVGLWHLGTVTAACLASMGHEVVGLDFDIPTVQQLRGGQPPIFEPGLADLVQSGLAQGCLSFTADPAVALAGAGLVWITYDTPVNDQDRADVDFVTERVERLFPYLQAGALVLISSQLPVGATRRLEQMYMANYPDTMVSFGYSPENLRLGKAISVFTQPDRVVVGIRTAKDREMLTALLQPFAERIEWMSVESAEMTKHAINAFLAVSIAFINEIATLCEDVGADAREVERGLKSEARIGPRAYLTPGAAFAGGTLARDIEFLTQIGAENKQQTNLLQAVRTSNKAHKRWSARKLQSLLGDLCGQVVAVWGLTYKPGTDTLRRSSSVELCEWLVQQGARIQVHDPAVRSLPKELAQQFELCSTPLASLAGAAALVVATEWPEYRLVTAADVVQSMSLQPLVIDPNRFLAQTLGWDSRLRYVALGTPIHDMRGADRHDT